jgi:hypothetical protein
MKHILAILATSLALTSQVFAASATLEYQTIDNATGTDQQNYNLTVRENIVKNLIGDVQFSQTTNDVGPGTVQRLEAGLTPTYKTKYATIGSRFTVGEKYTTTQQYGYWSANPYVAVPISNTGFTALAGWRYRAAFDTNYLDTTRTWRGGVQYAVTKQDTVGVRYDRVQGDSDSKVWAFYYTRGF